MKLVASLLFALSSLFLLSGCTPTVILGGAAIGGVAVAEERSVGTVVDDATIKVQVMNAIFQESEPLFTSTSTTVIAGTVLVTGEVPNPEDRVTISRLIWGVKGVKEVHNEITVNATVYLMGIAQNEAELNRVKAHAKDISGVRSIVSYVKMKSDT